MSRNYDLQNENLELLIIENCFYVLKVIETTECKQICKNHKRQLITCVSSTSLRLHDLTLIIMANNCQLS